MQSYLRQCQSHLQGLIAAAAAEPGGDFWPSVVDVRTGRRPNIPHTPQRVYRLIGAPSGSTLYWDQPQVVAAYVLSDMTGDSQYAEAADGYLDAFLSRCVSNDGLFQWGNHQYYDVFEQEVVSFHNGYHELRPITPAWEVFWRRAAAETETYIRVMTERHLYDPANGGFNRHDDRKKDHAFLEAGGILCESSAWLAGKTGDGELAATARRVAGYSFAHRHRRTGLTPNEPDHGRWDSRVSTSEIGLWAQCLLRAADYTGDPALRDMAASAVEAYLNHAFDPDSGRYFGQVNLETGEPTIPEKPGYWPRTYAEPWNTDQWPTHDYPMSTAEACLTFYRLTGDSVWRDHAQRWATDVVRHRPSRAGTWSYAENYGRCIHFLARAGRELDQPRYLKDARGLADEAVASLWENGMFRGYPTTPLYEAVDGVGFLLLALMSLETRRPTDLCGFGF